MPIWFFFLMGLILVIVVVIFWAVRKRTLSVLNKMHSDDALIETQCMIRLGAFEGPGVAQVLGDQLILAPIFGNVLRIPLSDVSLKKETWWWGRGWVGKRAFHLHTPYTKNLKIGVKDPAPWRMLFSGKGFYRTGN